jgi:ribosomal protein S18 acetylase RimI-like enzyme
MPDFEVSTIRATDAAELADLHIQCFQEYFLTSMGRPFLRCFYAEFARHDYDFAAIGRDRATGRIVGFVVGTADTQAHFRSFYRHNMLILPALLLARCVSNRTVRREMWKRTAHLKAALLALVPGVKRGASQTISDKGPPAQCPVRLLGMAVAADYRGTAVSPMMSQAFEDALRRAGHKRVGLSILPHNERAIGFFKKIGWQVVHASDAGVWFEKDL